MKEQKSVNNIPAYHHENRKNTHSPKYVDKIDNLRPLTSRITERSAELDAKTQAIQE